MSSTWLSADTRIHIHTATTVEALLPDTGHVEAANRFSEDFVGVEPAKLRRGILEVLPARVMRWAGCPGWVSSGTVWPGLDSRMAPARVINRTPRMPVPGGSATMSRGLQRSAQPACQQEGAGGIGSTFHSDPGNRGGST